MTAAAAVLVANVRAELRRAADPVRAPQMQAYMKSTMPYLGVGLPVIRKITRMAVADHPVDDLVDLIGAATDLWRPAAYREERYAATELTGLRGALGRLELLPLCTEMIATGAWWDHVDAVSHRIGAMLLAHPAALRPVIIGWSADPDRWLRRTSIICQLDFHDRTDLELLSTAIEANAADRDFFLRKAIGWALRQYARTDPAWVRGFVHANADVLSPLSRREALKHLG